MAARIFLAHRQLPEQSSEVAREECTYALSVESDRFLVAGERDVVSDYWGSKR